MRNDRAGPFFVHTMNAFARSTQFPATPRINCAQSRKRVNSRLADDGAALICGFPNDNSAPGFAKHLGWNVFEPDRMVDLTGASLLADPELIGLLTSTVGIGWDVNDVDQAKWRLSKPDARYESSEGLVTKDYEGVLNILRLDSSGLGAIDPKVVYRVLVQGGFDISKIATLGQFDYRFGSRLFDSRLRNIPFKREPILSDLF